jgi:hypothetical protein
LRRDRETSEQDLFAHGLTRSSIEKDALAGVIYSVTSRFDVPLMVTRGFSSETFAYEAIAARGGDDRPYHVYYLGDFDRAGRDAANSLEEKLSRFAEDGRLDVRFLPIAVNRSQIVQWRLPTLNARLRATIRSSLSQKCWGENCQTARQNAGADQRRQPRRRLPEPAPPIRGPLSGLGSLFPVSGETGGLRWALPSEIQMVQQ